MAVLIGVAGKKQSGKNTFAKFVAELAAEHHGWESREFSFAEKLKDTIADIFWIPRHLFDGTDEDKNSPTRLLWADVSEHLRAAYNRVDVGKFITIRELMQLFGTESCRGVWPSIWVANFKAIVSDYKGLAICTDVRFADELMAVKALGGQMVHVLRNVNRGDTANHISELNLDAMPDASFDYIVRPTAYRGDGERTIEDVRRYAEEFFFHYFSCER